jgi:hypothetical protein
VQIWTWFIKLFHKEEPMCVWDGKALVTCPVCHGAWRDGPCQACTGGLICPDPEHGKHYFG